MDTLDSLPDSVSAAFYSIIQKDGITNVKINVEGAVPKGQNYSGVIYRVILTGEKDGRFVTSYIVKVACDNESIRNEIGLSMAYSREVMYYTELFPIYQQMQEEVGIPFEDQFRFAKCYHGDKEYLKEFLIFEDLKSQGFVTLNRKCEADYEHVRCALEAYGKLHAMSFVLKKKEPEKFKYFIENISELGFIKGNKLTTLFIHACEKAIPVVENIKHKEILERLKDNIVDRVIDLLTQDEFSAISHSDCWSANMMFNYKKGKPVETCLIDFQVCRYGSPTLDVMYYIFGNTGHKLRVERYEDLLTVYHDAMKNHLKAFSYDIQEIYPWSRFKQDLKKSSIMGLVMGISVAMIMLADENLTPELSDFADITNSEVFKSKASDAYKERVNGILEDLITYENLS